MVAVLVLLNVAGLRIGQPAPEDSEVARKLLQSPAARAFASALGLAAIVGFFLDLVFVVRLGRRTQSMPPVRLQPSVPLISLLVFLLSFFVLSGVVEILALLTGVDPGAKTGAAAYLLLQASAMIGASALGVSALVLISAMTREDPREIGWRRASVGAAIAWGVAGYLAALPLLFAGLAVSQAVFRNVETPEHPIVRTVLSGGAAFWAAALLAVVIAPVVEETFFRGMLYTALRSRIGVWASAVASATFFAAIHPTLPAGFLPILALGVVLAVLRERTGSLIPSMVCHGLNNAVALALVRLLY